MSDNDETRYGYIGMGMMGSAMTERLLSTGAHVTVFDIDEEAVAAAVGLGAVAANSAAEVAAATDIVSTCVPAAHHVEAVLTGPQGLRDGAHDGLTLLIHSTVHPDTMTGARDQAAEWGVAVFDACVAGGDGAARVGELAIFAGGHEQMSPETKALLEVYGSKVINGGEVGAGAALKIGVNVMTYLQQAAASISFGLMNERGADTGALVDAWRHIGQLGQLTEQFLPLLSIPAEHITGDFRRSLENTAGIAQKDLELALALGGSNQQFDAIVEATVAAMPAIMGVP